MKKGVEIFGTAILVLYPLVVWVGISAGGGRTVGVVVLIALIVVALTQRHIKAFHWGAGHLVVLPLLAALSIVFDRQRLLFVAPLVVNVVLLLTFSTSLLGARVPLVERLARVMDPDLTPERVAYCRTVTKVWCVFFLLNGSVVAWLSVYGSVSAWGLYTGGIAYGLMGLVFVAEYAVRRIRFG